MEPRLILQDWTAIDVLYRIAILRWPIAVRPMRPLDEVQTYALAVSGRTGRILAMQPRRGQKPNAHVPLREIG